ncbi:hypothetical protein KIN20_026871 [Parelaphostrongylus tenuis]|uniref:Uncharacterized protein n=1 Tax=Parelaphostrongylus tenuis TaxID=148309 RepID=A0AAD5QYL2_PARTN|nr:hypothetical protein KIN20_026871 [Parelaphostrongylus tenuis]
MAELTGSEECTTGLPFVSVKDLEPSIDDHADPPAPVRSALEECCNETDSPKAITTDKCMTTIARNSYKTKRLQRGSATTRSCTTRSDDDDDSTMNSISWPPAYLQSMSCGWYKRYIAK